MVYIYPDLDWYTGLSKTEGVPTRCPYANVYKCPRYYASLYLLGDVGITTKISPKKIEELNVLWERSNIDPIIAEYDTGIINTTGFSNFCPEVSYDVFRLFADFLYRYSDETDIEVAHAKLEKEAYPKDWRWEWASVSALHYVMCSIYSQLLPAQSSSIATETPTQNQAEILEIKPGFMGITINIKALFRWIIKQRSFKRNKQPNNSVLGINNFKKK